MANCELSRLLLASYFRVNTYPASNIQSYEKFVNSLSTIFTRHGKRSWCYQESGEHTRTVKFDVCLQEPQLLEPQLSADDAYQLRTTYTAAVTAQLYINRNGGNVHREEVVVFEIPHMVYPTSSDIGGYFIVNGTERVVVTQEILCNLPHTVNYSSSDSEHYITSGRNSLKLARRGSGPVYVTKLGSNPLQKNASARDLTVIQLSLLFMALGVETAEAASVCCKLQGSSQKLSNEIDRVIQQSWNSLPGDIKDQQSALKLISELIGCKNSGAAAIEHTLQQIYWACFPQYNSENSAMELKATALGLMTHRLLRCCIGERETHDTHHIGRKRYDRVGNMLIKLVSQGLKSLLSGSRKSIEAAERAGFFDASNRMNLSTNFINANYITNKLCSAIGSGNILEYEGISQVFNRMNMASQIAHLCCIQKSIVKEAAKMTEPRSFHIQSATGFIDSHHTPEGAKCGIIIYPTSSKFSTARDAEEVWLTVKRTLQRKLKAIGSSSRPFLTQSALFYLNGVLRGTVSGDCKQALQLLRRAKIEQRLPYDCSVYYTKLDNELHVWCDENRIIRPLLRLPLPSVNYCRKHDWMELIKEGYIEYVSPFEAEMLTIAECIADVDTAVHSHCEFSSLAIMSYGSAKVPYGDSDPACRIAYNCAQDKQAVPTRTAAVRGDYHQLWYGQKPLASSCIDEVIREGGIENDMLEGVNAVVAVLCYGGYNQEDAIIFKKSSIDRGMFRSFFFKNYYMEEDEAGVTRICRYDEEDSCRVSTATNYGDKSMLETDGLPVTGGYIQEGQAVIGACSRRSDGQLRDSSLIIKKRNGGVVEKTALMQISRADRTGRKRVDIRAASVTVRSSRTPIIGDKFSSRHGQKGTIGMIYREEDLPFTVDGIVPDIIINPHAVPTRMTVAQFIEALTALVTCLTGKFFDATPLQCELGTGAERLKAIREQLCTELTKRGLHSMGNVAMMNGMTGELLQHSVFMAPVHYKRLRHMVQDKEYTRARGAVNSTTRQPTEGRSKGGGLRFGEMERDAAVGSGSALFVKDRLHENSDAHKTTLCSSCGLFGIVRSSTGFRCSDSRCVGGSIVTVTVPYALELFFKELMSMNITPRIKVQL